MQTKIIKIFCAQSELATWLKKLAQMHRLQIVAYDSEFRPLVVKPELLELDLDWVRVFLIPSSQKLPLDLSNNSIAPSKWGWIDVRPGGLVIFSKNKFVKMTMIYAKGDKNGPLDWNLFAELKKQIRRDAKAGVCGKNILTSGQSDYPHTWHTEAARMMLCDGAAWKQSVEFNVIFSPLT